MITGSQLAQAQTELERILNEEVIATSKRREKFMERSYQKFCQQKKDLGIPVRVSREEFIDDFKRDNKLIYLRPKHPLIIGLGEHQIVLGLNNDLVAKMQCRPGPYGLFAVGRRPYRYLKETQNTLFELGISLQNNGFLRLDWEGNRLVLNSDVNHQSWKGEDFELENIPNICVTLDLREGGNYKVINYGGRNIRDLINKEEIASQFQEWTKILRKLEQNLSIGITWDPHLSSYKAKLKSVGAEREEAIRRMFLVQVPYDKSKPGKLVAGDLDHIYVYPIVEESL